MKRILLLTLCSVLLYVSSAGAAEALKIGFVDLQRIFAESDAGKRQGLTLRQLKNQKSQQ